MRITRLIYNISNNDPNIWDAITSFCINNSEMIYNFEWSATFLIPVCSYANHQATNNNNICYTQISDLDTKGKQHSSTGVGLCWHTKKEY